MTPSGAMGMDCGRRPPGAIRSGHGVVAIRVPASPEYFVILRATAAQLAPRLGCTAAEISELRLAVDEACGLLLRNCITLTAATKQDDLTAMFAVDGPALHITLRREADASITPDSYEFGWAILTALVDDCAWRVEDAAVHLEIRKQRAPGR